MEKYFCEICKKEVLNFKNGLFVKIKDKSGNLVRVTPVHKGDCDESLFKKCLEEGLNANASMEISYFATEEDRASYLNGEDLN